MTGARDRLDAIKARVNAFPDDADLAAMHAALTAVLRVADKAEAKEKEHGRWAEEAPTVGAEHEHATQAARYRTIHTAIRSAVEAALQSKGDRS
jgi:hypothetical protein